LPAPVINPILPDAFSADDVDPAPPPTCPVCGARLGRKAISCATCENRREQKRMLFIRIAGGVAALLVVIAILFLVPWRPHKKPAAFPIPPDGTWLPQPKVKIKIPKSLDNLKIGAFHLERKPGSEVSLVIGDIENASENLHRDVRVTFELLDASGTIIGAADDFITELPANGVWHVIARTTQTSATSARFIGIKESP
jgi:predicted nucleic acid-binding Zn ribbon protein